MELVKEGYESHEGRGSAWETVDRFWDIFLKGTANTIQSMRKQKSLKL